MGSSGLGGRLKKPGILCGLWADHKKGPILGTGGTGDDRRHVHHGRLDTNLEKTKAMVCTPGFIWGKTSKVVYKRRVTREGGVLGRGEG